MRIIRWVIGVLMCSFSFPGWGWAQAVLEVPSPGSMESGVKLIQGWRCEPALIQVQIDAGPLFTAAYGTSRNDTIGVCGDAENGWGLTFNWNLSGDGMHTIRAFADGVEFGSATFSVQTLGAEFLTGLTGSVIVQDFPETGKNVGLEWQQSSQNFVITQVFDKEAVEIIENGVANLTDVSAFTVPSDRRLIITDVIISNSNSSSSCCARISRNGPFVTGFIAVEANSSFEHTFLTGIEFGPGDMVGVRNGASSGPLDFYLRGYLTNP